MAFFNMELLDLLVCPQTRGPLIFNPHTQELISEYAKLAFPVKDGIPILLIDQARPLTDDESL